MAMMDVEQVGGVVWGSGTEGSCNGTGKEWMCWEGG